jgi:uncharacterized membrane protein YfcA
MRLEISLMGIEIILFIIIGAFTGGFVSGLSGFGTGLFALGWWLAVMPPIDAVIVVVIMSLVGGAQGIYAVRKAVDMANLWRFLLPALVGIGVGVWLLDLVDVNHLKLLVASLLILFGGYFSFQKTLPKLGRHYLAVDMAVGWIGGVLGMLAGLSGALLTMWVSLYDWPKVQRRAVIQSFNMLVLSLVFMLLAWRGLLDVHILLLVAIALPSSVVGTQVGIRVFQRLSDQQFQQILIWLTLISGLVLAGSELAVILGASKFQSFL